MSTVLTPTERKIAIQETWTTLFYWIGAIMSVLCIALAWTRNTELVARFDQRGFPLAWAAGAIAILALLASEYCHPAPPAKSRVRRPVPETPRESLAWETEFADS
jgi:hypothetical protein